MATFDPFDMTPDEARRASVTLAREESDLDARQDRHYYANLARTDRYGK